MLFVDQSAIFDIIKRWFGPPFPYRFSIHYSCEIWHVGCVSLDSIGISIFNKRSQSVGSQFLTIKKVILHSKLIRKIITFLLFIGLDFCLIECVELILRRWLTAPRQSPILPLLYEPRGLTNRSNKTPTQFIISLDVLNFETVKYFEFNIKIGKVVYKSPRSPINGETTELSLSNAFSLAIFHADNELGSTGAWKNWNWNENESKKIKTKVNLLWKTEQNCERFKKIRSKLSEKNCL